MTQATPNKKEAVIAALLNAGFTPDGNTPQETVRIPTVETPVYGGIGGKLTTLGGRQRFMLPGTSIKVTVGKITTYFYEVLPNQPMRGIAHLQTSNLEAVNQAILTVKVNA